MLYIIKYIYIIRYLFIKHYLISILSIYIDYHDIFIIILMYVINHTNTIEIISLKYTN